MSRQNPTNSTPNPATRWFNWNGSNGTVEYYDKTLDSGKGDGKNGRTVVLPAKFAFVLLDSLAVIKGWHDPSESGITSNEVRDTRTEPFIVRAFKGGVLAEGLYAAIKDRVAAQGGSFHTNCYIGYRDAASILKLGSIQFKGAALNAWVDFTKANRKELWEKAVSITGFTEGKKGKITFRVPTFKLSDITKEVDDQAGVLQEEFKVYLQAYFAKTTAQRPPAPVQDAPQQEPEAEMPPDTEPEPEAPPVTDAFDGEEPPF